MSKRKLPEGWEKKEIWSLIEFEKKTWRSAKDWVEKDDKNIYKFFKSWEDKNVYSDKFDFDWEYLTVWDGWSANVHYINWKFWVSWHNFVFKSIQEKGQNVINNKLLYYFLFWTKNKWNKLYTWIWMTNISKNDFSKINIFFPKSPTEQQKIVDYLDKQFGFIDNMESEINEYSKKLDELEKGILEESFSWFEKVNIEEFVITKYWINTWREKKWNYWLVRISDLTKEWFVSKNDQVFINKTEDEIKNYKLKYWDILLCRIWVDAGKIWLFNYNDYNAIHAWYLIKLNFNETDFLNKFIWYYWKSKDYWEQVEKLISWTTTPQFNAPAFKKMFFPKTNLNTQKQIAYKLDKQFELINSTRQEIKKQEQNLKELRKAILHDIFGGFEE